MQSKLFRSVFILSPKVENLLFISQILFVRARWGFHFCSFSHFKNWSVFFWLLWDKWDSLVEKGGGHPKTHDRCECLLSYLHAVLHLATEVCLWENSRFVSGGVAYCFQNIDVQRCTIMVNSMCIQCVARLPCIWLGFRLSFLHSMSLSTCGALGFFWQHAKVLETYSGAAKQCECIGTRGVL